MPDQGDKLNSEEPSKRERYNRFAGLYAYAAGTVIAAFWVWMLFDEIKSRGIAGLQKDWQPVAIIAAVALIFFAIGYTTKNRRLH